MVIPYCPTLKEIGRVLRNSMTESEQKLWAYLRKKQILGVQFYRQKPLLGFVVDFYGPSAHLVIEVDGAQHFEEGAISRDRQRDELLSRYGLSVLRFDNGQVLRETETVLEMITAQVIKRLGVS